MTPATIMTAYTTLCTLLLIWLAVKVGKEYGRRKDDQDEWK